MALSEPHLHGVSRTLLVTLAARARGAALFPHLGFQDPAAEAVCDALGIDPAQFARTAECVYGVVRRSMVIDDIVARFADEHGAATVLNLAAGLSTTFERAGRADLAWFDLDLAEPAALHRALIAPDPARRLVVGDIGRPGWTRGLSLPPGPLLVIAEGIMPYLTWDCVAGLLDELAVGFADRPLRLAYDTFAFPMVGMARLHPSIGPLARTDPSIEFRSGVRSMSDYAVGRPEWPLQDVMPVMEGMGPLHSLACFGFSAAFGVPFYAVAVLDHHHG
ncbi:O-Methyltransferase involved in polyketide biosynthesis [Pseudoxanthobacter soli DSM 19599]|uniref:O-Methyltransferase involved in polyketide biosynthesis n=1 Tax=Pseudoxanthobacter soli DSM 19599 TaxID=1123029 RepID=A0A1M7Z993_9HYPH|nr:class I SAM-dependent methyltransferase [Pseudoxanthobacter soli]SHO61497.1 O-Methyltransferase involved in polyketide biosynthesis [Pseudoxanthobacter soli DSM 19599]